MTVKLSAPPTYADPVIVDDKTKKGTFNPLWLGWFLTLAQAVEEMTAQTQTDTSLTQQIANIQSRLSAAGI